MRALQLTQVLSTPYLLLKASAYNLASVPESGEGHVVCAALGWQDGSVSHVRFYCKMPGSLWQNYDADCITSPFTTHELALDNKLLVFVLRK